MKVSLRIIGAFGVVLFACLFSVTFLSPEAIEDSAKGFVEYQIEKEIQEKQQAIQESSVASSVSLREGSLI